jgi:hypothetical protein
LNKISLLNYFALSEIIKSRKEKLTWRREVRAVTVASALEGWGKSGVRCDVAGRYLPPPLDSA